MKPFILIRDYNKNDDVSTQDLIKCYIMSYAWSSFIQCLFRGKIFNKIDPNCNESFFFFFHRNYNSIDCIDVGSSIYICWNPLTLMLPFSASCNFFDTLLRLRSPLQ